MTDTTNDPFLNQQEQVNYLDYAKQKFAAPDGNVDLEKLAQGKYESDKFISTLQQELAELRKKADQGMSVKDLLEELRKQQSAPPVNNGEPTPVNPPASPQNTDDLAKIVRDTLDSTERERREAANKATVVSKLNEEFGGNAGAELAKKANELGISVKRLEEIGKESPIALFNLLGLGSPRNIPGSTTVPTGRVQMPNTNTGDRTKKYYDELYRTNPAARHDSKITAQKHRDALRLGDRFLDN